MTTSSIYSAIQKLRSVLTREEKYKCLKVVCFSFLNSVLEMLTASIVVIFAQVLNDPQIGAQYLLKIGYAVPMTSTTMIFNLAIIVGVVYFVKNIVAALELYYQNISIQTMNFNFKNRLLNRYANYDYNFYLTRNSSLGSQVVGGDAELIFSNGMTSLASLLSEGLIFICLTSLIIYMKPSLALMIFPLGIAVGFIIWKILLPKFYRWGQHLQEAAINSGQNLIQFFHGFKEIILLGKRDFFINAYQQHSYKKSRVQAVQTTTHSLPRLVIEVLFVGLFITVIAFLCSNQESPTQMIGILGGYLYTGFRLMPGLNRLINQLNSFKAAIPSIERVFSEYNMVGREEVYLNLPSFSFEKSLVINDLSFNYLNSTKNAISNINLEIFKGECVGIIGETGSGKSTLIDLILGLLRPSQGYILIDGQFTVHSLQWHEKIGYVPQSVYLVDDTIEANIAFGEKEIDHNRVNAAIDAAQLRCFIDSLTQGVKTIVGERGVRLSGGERQRIAIARSLYRKPEVLIFDEATSALDMDTESRLISTIDTISKDRTVIMVAHRLTTLKGCNRIVIMNNGRIERIVKYNELADNKMRNHG